MMQSSSLSCSNDKITLQWLINNYTPRIYHLCLKILSNQEDAKDACQETFVKVIQHPRKLASTHALPWVLKVATNVCLKILRQKRHQKKLYRDAGRLSPSTTEQPHPLPHPAGGYRKTKNSYEYTP
jgi:RNA polymerase sigma factor (sigma-70 family)